MQQSHSMLAIAKLLVLICQTCLAPIWPSRHTSQAHLRCYWSLERHPSLQRPRMTSMSFRSASNMTQIDRQTDGRTDSEGDWPETTQQHLLLVAQTNVTDSLQPTPNYSWQMTLLSLICSPCIKLYISFYFRFFRRIFSTHRFNMCAMLCETGALFGLSVHVSVLVCLRKKLKKNYLTKVNITWS